MQSEPEITTLSSSDIANMPQRNRAMFINSIGGFKSLVMVGTKSAEGVPNLAVFSSLVHLGAIPPVCGLVVRPGQEERHTLTNILNTSVYTLNHVHQSIVRQAHQTSARYPSNVSEFDAVGLTPQYKDNFEAPFVRESVVQLGLRLRQVVPLVINETTLVIGEIVHVSVPTRAIGENGFVDLESLGSLTVSGLDSYHRTAAITRLPYAKP